MPDSRRTGTEIEAFLQRLERVSAHELESQDLDFKEWDTHSPDQSVRTVVAAAVCMANGGGGTVVFGVADKFVGRDAAILGVPPEVSVNRLRVAVYDSTDPRLTPVFQERCMPTPGCIPTRTLVATARGARYLYVGPLVGGE